MESEESPQRIHRAQSHDRSNPFTRISNAAMHDSRLSFRARGVLAYVLSKPETFNHSAEGLSLRGGEGRDAMRNSLKELKTHGYCREVRRRDEKGRCKTHLVFFEQPTTDIQSSDSNRTDDGKPVIGPTTDNQSPDNRRLENRPSVNQAPIKQRSKNECLETNERKQIEGSTPSEKEPQGDAIAPCSGLNSFKDIKWQSMLEGNPLLARAWRAYVMQWGIAGKKEEPIRINLVKRALVAGMPMDQLIDALISADYGGVILVKRCKEFLDEDPGRTGVVPV